MPVPVAVTDRRGPRLLAVLFWAGVAFAPVAALILLVADGNGPLRVAAVLAIVAVVLIGLSIALRADGGGGADQAETERLRDEIEELRRDLRDEIVAAARRGNQALDASQRIQDQVSALRRRLDAAAASIAADPEPPAVEPPAVKLPAPERAGAGRARVPVVEAYDDAGLPRDTADDAPPGRARVRAVAPEGDEPPVRRSRATARPGAEAPAAAFPPASGPGESESRSSRHFGPDSVPRPVGMVRHTETVHVTTRHTVVDGPDPATGRYGGPAGRWSAAPGEQPWAAPSAEAPWSGRHAGRAGQHDDARWSEPPDAAGRPGRRDDPADDSPWADPAHDPRWGDPAHDSRWGDPADDPRWLGREDGPGSAVDGGPRHSDPRPWDAAEAGWPAGAGPVRAYPPEPAPAGTGQWSELRACDRWAEVHDDDRGREVRIGERRAAAHADAAGSGYRVEDRWASLRDAPAGAWAEPVPPPGGAAVPSQWGSPARRDARPAGSGRAPAPEPDRPSRHQRPDEDQYAHDDAPRPGGTPNRWR